MRDLSGEIFSELKVLELSSRVGSKGQRYWFVECICGNRYNVREYELVKGRVHSCGCRRRMRKNGDTDESESQMGLRQEVVNKLGMIACASNQCIFRVNSALSDKGEAVRCKCLDLCTPRVRRGIEALATMVSAVLILGDRSKKKDKEVGEEDVKS